MNKKQTIQKLLQTNRICYDIGRLQKCNLKRLELNNWDSIHNKEITDLLRLAKCVS